MRFYRYDINTDNEDFAVDLLTLSGGSQILIDYREGLSPAGQAYFMRSMVRWATCILEHISTLNEPVDTAIKREIDGITYNEDKTPHSNFLTGDISLVQSAYDLHYIEKTMHYVVHDIARGDALTDIGLYEYLEDELFDDMAAFTALDGVASDMQSAVSLVYSSNVITDIMAQFRIAQYDALTPQEQALFIYDRREMENTRVFTLKCGDDTPLDELYHQQIGVLFDMCAHLPDADKGFNNGFDYSQFYTAIEQFDIIQSMSDALWQGCDTYSAYIDRYCEDMFEITLDDGAYRAYYKAHHHVSRFPMAEPNDIDTYRSYEDSVYAVMPDGDRRQFDKDLQSDFEKVAWDLNKPLVHVADFRRWVARNMVPRFCT